MPNVLTTLQERHKTHGRFDCNAHHSQALKKVIHDSASWHDFDHVQREALDYLACKIARILSTQGRHIDDWHDIGGYATLVEKWLRGEVL